MAGALQHRQSVSLSTLPCARARKAPQAQPWATQRRSKARLRPPEQARPGTCPGVSHAGHWLPQGELQR